MANVHPIWVWYSFRNMYHFWNFPFKVLLFLVVQRVVDSVEMMGSFVVIFISSNVRNTHHMRWIDAQVKMFFLGPAYAKEGKCTSEDDKNWMQENCRRSCKLCRWVYCLLCCPQDWCIVVSRREGDPPLIVSDKKVEITLEDQIKVLNRVDFISFLPARYRRCLEWMQRYLSNNGGAGNC